MHLSENPSETQVSKRALVVRTEHQTEILSPEASARLHITTEMQITEKSLQQLAAKMEKNQSEWDFVDFLKQSNELRTQMISLGVDISNVLSLARTNVLKQKSVASLSEEEKSGVSTVTTAETQLQSVTELARLYEATIATFRRTVESRVAFNRALSGTQSLSDISQVLTEHGSSLKNEAQSVSFLNAEGPKRKMATIVSPPETLRSFIESLQASIQSQGNQWGRSRIAGFIEKLGERAFPQGMYERILKFAQLEGSEKGEAGTAHQFFRTFRTEAVTMPLEDLLKKIHSFDTFSLMTHKNGATKNISCANIWRGARECLHNLRFILFPNGGTAPSHEELQLQLSSAGVPSEFGIADVLTTKITAESRGAGICGALSQPDKFASLREMSNMLRLGGDAVLIQTIESTLPASGVLERLDKMLREPSWKERPGFLRIGARKNDKTGVRVAMAAHNLTGNHQLYDRIAELLYSEVVLGKVSP